MSANEIEKTQTPRCGHETSSGLCVRPLNHGHGHMSAEVLRVKTANAKADSNIRHRLDNF
jgi:hypothetical protein